MIEIRRYVSDLMFSNMYLIVEGNHAIVIDPCRDISSANGLTIDMILLTHEHYDHISGVNLWKEVTGAPVLCSDACARHIQSPRDNLARIFPVFCELQTWVELTTAPEADLEYACTADECFEDRMTLPWRGHQLELFEIPGHSLGSIGIMLDRKSFFSGDSLMEHYETEVRLPGGSRKKWNEIGAPRIAAIPSGVLVYPGHFQEFIYEKKGGEVIGVSAK